MKSNSKQVTVHYPSELATSHYTGEVSGLFHPESNHFNILEWGEKKPSHEIFSVRNSYALHHCL